MKSACQDYCQEAIELSHKLFRVAEDGQSTCDHDACLVLFGIILDSASVIQREAIKRVEMLKTEVATKSKKTSRPPISRANNTPHPTE